MTQTPEMREAIAKQPFERHPALASWIERLANTDCLPLGDWMVFLGALNLALSAPSPVVEGQGASTETERGDGSLPVPSQTQSPAGRSGPVWPKRGDKMVFMNRNGYDSEREAAAKVFEVGKPLTVAHCEVGSWSHSVWFDEVPQRGWNGVMFKMVGAPERYLLPAESDAISPTEGRAGNLAGDEPPSSSPPQATNSEVERLRAEADAEIIAAAHALVMEPGGLRMTPSGTYIVEKADKSDPHYRLCKAFDARAALDQGVGES